MEQICNDERKGKLYLSQTNNQEDQTGSQKATKKAWREFVTTMEENYGGNQNLFHSTLKQLKQRKSKLLNIIHKEGNLKS